MWPGTPSSSRCTRKNSGERSLTGSLRSGRRRGISGAPWYRSSTTRSSCRRLMFLCRRRGTSWWRCSGSSIFTSPSKPSKCPRPHLHPVILARAVCVSRSRRRNSWWKCLRSYHIPVPHGRGGRVGVRGLQSFPGQDSTAFVGAARVDIPVPRSGGLQGSRPRQASSASSAHSPGVADEAFTVFFSLFPKRKKCEVRSALGVGTECGHWFIHAGGLAGGLLHRRRRWRVDEASFWTMDVARLGPARHPRRARLGLVLGTWRATWGAAASSWLLEASVVLTSTSFWSTLFPRRPWQPW